MLRVSSSEKPDGVTREAEEVYVCMNRTFRVSRNIRAHWFFEHINQTISIDNTDFETDQKNAMSVIGILPKGGKATELIVDEKFLVTAQTKVIYVSRYYRQVYVLDLSPSVIVADEETDCCLYNKLTEVLFISLRSITKPFTLPGTTTTFYPQIYVSIIVFVPFLAFEEDQMLVNSHLINNENVGVVMDQVYSQYQKLKLKLYKFSQPVMRKWAQIRRRHKSRLDSTCIDEVADDVHDVTRKVSQEQQITSKTLAVPRFKQMFPISQSTFAVSKRIFDSENTKPDRSKQVEAKEEGYIIPELALLFMLRLGLTVVQTMPENTHSNVIVITDGVGGMPAPESLQDILRELRAFTISCSFIELKGKSTSAPCFGHVTSGDLFHFLSTATFGGYIPNCKCVLSNSEFPSDSISDDFYPLNPYHKTLLCWSFQNALQENKHIVESIRDINPSFEELYKTTEDYDIHLNTKYETTLSEILYVRLREGFTVKQVEINNNRIEVKLALAFRPMIFLEYVIRAPWPNNVREFLEADLVVSGPVSEIRDLKISKMTEGVYRANMMRVNLVNQLEDACRRIREADSLLIHIHKFNNDPVKYAIPRGAERTALFHFQIMRKGGKERSDKILVCKNRQRFPGDPFAKFIKFWQKICTMNPDEWQKWVHVHIERAILFCHQFDDSKGRKQVNCTKAEEIIHRHFSQSSSFCLISKELYVIFVAKKDNPIPAYFYMIRVEQTLPCIVFKVAFLGGIDSHERIATVNTIKKSLESLTFENGEKVLYIMKRPLERLLIQYDEIPMSFHLAQWTMEEIEDSPIKLSKVEHENHNATTKYLEGRRAVWKIPLGVHEDRTLDNYKMSRKIAEIAMNALFQKRINEGFKIAWTKNKTIGLCKEIEVEGEAPLRTILEQYILFYPERWFKKEIDKPRDSIRAYYLMAEFWREPCLIKDEPGVQSPRAQLDDDLVVSIFTAVHLETICKEHKTSIMMLNVSVDELYYKDSKEKEESGQTKEKNEKFVTPRITLIEEPFNIHTLLKHSRRLLLHLPTFEISEDGGQFRNELLSNIFFNELAVMTTCWIDVPDPSVFAKIFTQLLIDLKDEKRQVDILEYKKIGYDSQYLTKCRVFLKYGETTPVTMIIVPAIDVLPEENTRWPVIVSIVDSTLVINSIVRNRPHNRVFEYVMKKTKGEMVDFPTENDLYDADVIEWICEGDSHIMRASYRPTAVKPFVQEIQGAILDKATIGALYKCLRKGRGGLLNQKDVSFILDELCDYTTMEVHSVPESLNSFCRHIGEDPQMDNFCCDGSTLQSVFNDVLHETKLRPIAADPRYFYFDPYSLEESSRKTSINEVPSYKASVHQSEWTGTERRSNYYIEECPLFVLFHCVLQLPNGDEEYVQISYLPACINQVLQTAKKEIPVEDIHKVKLKLLFYVLTWTIDDEIDNDEPEGVSLALDFHGRIKKFLKKLPKPIRETVKNTRNYMNRLLEKESILMDNRFEQIELSKIMKISHFITETVGKNYCDFSVKQTEKLGFLSSQVKQRFRSLKFVIPSTDAFNTLVQRLDGKKIDFCVLQRVEGSNIFYIRRPENKKEYELWLKEQYKEKQKETKKNRYDSLNRPTLTRTDSEVSVFSNNEDMDKIFEPKPGTCHFWVILSLEKIQRHNVEEEIIVRLQFCERYACDPSFYKIYLNCWQEARIEIKRVNQEILLKNMYATRHCSPFLLAKKEKEETRERHYSLSDEEDSTLDLSLAKTANYDFAPGSLACPLVWEHWIKIHPRLRKNHISGPFHEVAVMLRRSFEQQVVNNVPNTFVFKSECGYILYGQIYSSFDQFIKSRKKYQTYKDFDREEMKRKFALQEKENRILFAGFGVTDPPDTLKEVIAKHLIEKKLSDQVLDLLNSYFKRNPLALLEPTDVEFIQPDCRKPAALYYFPIPSIMNKYTNAIRIYYGQHMHYFRIQEARLKESRSGQVNHRQFLPYPANLVPGHPSNPKYIPNFRLFNVNKGGGIRSYGLAVIELRIVDKFGVIDKPQDGRIRLESHNLLTCHGEGFYETNQEWFKKITTTNCLEIKNPNLEINQHPAPPEYVEDCCGFVQAIIWQAGDVGLIGLRNILTEVVEGSLMDVVTEYGILNTEIVETMSSSYPPPNSPSASTPTKNKTPLSGQKIQKKRDSTEAVNFSGIQTPNPLDSSKRNSIFTYETGNRRGSNHDLPPSRDDMVLPIARAPEHLSMSFQQTADLWFSYIATKRLDAYQYKEFHLRHSVLIPQTLNQIEIELKKILEHPILPNLSDKVQLFKLMEFGENKRYDLVTGQLKDEIVSDATPLDSRQDVQARYILTAYCEIIHQETRRYGFEIMKNKQEAPQPLQQLITPQQQHDKFLFLPNLEDSFVPRQTFVYLKEQNNIITLHTYNLMIGTEHGEQVCDRILNAIHRIVLWQNAKYRLYEHIIDHPLDPVLPEVPQDWRTKDNNYIMIIRYDPESLIDKPSPPEFIKVYQNDVPISAEIANRLFRARRSYTAHVILHCKVQRAFQQFKEMRKEVIQLIYAYQSNKVMYDALAEGQKKVEEQALNTMWGHCRRVHYVQTPVLLSPAWRRKIAQVRLGVAEAPPKPKSIPSGVLSSRSRAGTSNTSSVTKQSLLPTKTKEEEELFDPCHVKMLYDLTNEYVAYLKTLGLNFLDIEPMNEESKLNHRYTMTYPTGGKKPPDICLFRQMNHGIILIRLNFVPPYFIMSIGMWAAPELLLRDQSLTERESKKFLTDLEFAKDTIVAKCHIHSFTYDFHLRMISRYLMDTTDRSSQVLFPIGYNTSTFLIDFMKYYACRPPSARNCVYEDRVSFNLHKNVSSRKVWECFLDRYYGEKYKWKVMRIRVNDDKTETDNTRVNEYMCVKISEDQGNDGYAKICCLLRDRRRKEIDGYIHTSQYMILVDVDRNRPLEEGRMREDSNKSNVGEFRNVSIPTEEQLLREVDDMMALISKGGMPTVEGVVSRRRRFSSGENTSPHQLTKSGETESSINSPLHGSESDINVPVQGDPTLRHRKSAGSSEEGEIPTEKANYIQYISVSQRRLQQLLETTANEYSEQIRNAVDQANKECLREFLWCSVHTMLSSEPHLPKLGQSVRLGTSNDIWGSLKFINHEQPHNHIVELWKMVEAESMKTREPRLTALLENANCARFCRFLVYKFGPKRCHLFENPPHDGHRRSDISPDQSPLPILRHLLITDANTPVTFVVRCEDVKNPDIFILFRKQVSEMKGPVTDYTYELLDKAFDELVQTATSFLWSDLIYRPPGKAN